MSLDARVRYTKKVIQESFCELLQDKPFHKITLKEVCDRALINRTTFYRHYSDIYAWKEQVENECLDRVEEMLEEADKTNVRALMLRQLEGMKANADLYALISSPNFESNVLEISVAMVLESAVKRTKASVDSAGPKDYWDCYFLVHGILGVIDCWLKNGMRESPEEIADYYYEQFKRLMLTSGKGVRKDSPAEIKRLRKG